MLHTDTVAKMDSLEKRFENIALLLNEASLLLDMNSTVMAANDKAIDLLGSHITGLPLDRFLRHPDFAEAIKRAGKEGKLATLDYTRMDQIRRNFSLRLAPFDEGYVLLVIFDGTMMQSVERIRSDFVANVSHELRSPLGALSGFIETLIDGAVEEPESRAHFLSIMKTEAARMQRLIDDLLSLSQVEAEEHRAPQDEIDLNLLLNETVSVIGASAKQDARKLTVTVCAPDNADELRVFGDADELRQVFQNLLENALRYGDTDADIEIIVDGGRTESGQPRPDLLRVQVINQGPTIAPEHLARLTERFYRIDSGRSRQMGGTGLGLAIVKHIINRHRGRLRLSSSGGKTSASVTLRRYMGS